ncbi:hypothetical protein QF91_002732 [Salmonella enterica subsp. salamae]|nr:hypothetical protein [Salmonella enterica subsp. salamae]EDV5905872.1 hypothetical protein [Salmonella enterica subsp. salamae]EEL7720362.1 hypothetical protein [Salmonella enterica]
MTKPASTIKTLRRQHSPEFRQEALKLAERIGVAAAAQNSLKPITSLRAMSTLRR